MRLRYVVLFGMMSAAPSALLACGGSGGGSQGPDGGTAGGGGLGGSGGNGGTAGGPSGSGGASGGNGSAGVSGSGGRAGSGGPSGGGSVRDAGATPAGDSGAPSGGMGGVAGAGGSGGTYDYWPNPDAPANSDPWLVENHDRIRVMRPRVLVLDVQRVGRPIENVTEDIIEAIAESSRYHGYSNPDAPVFFEYQIEKIVDLRDPDGAEYPDFWPPGPNFDVGELFTEEFAPRFGFEDPEQPGRYSTMCELFEQGVIHELWIAAEAGVRAVYENQSRMQRYDADFDKIPGSFQECTNGCYNDPQDRVECSVSVRMQEVNKGRGPGCFIHAAGHALENMRAAIPYIGTHGDRFFYFNLRERHGLPYDRLYEIDCFLGQPQRDRRCSFPDPTTLEYDPSSGQGFTFTEFGQGCGDVHHKPNIYGSGVVASHACEHYGLRDGENGRDQMTLYSQEGSLADEKMAEYEQRFGDCDGGWNVYMRQSMPGYDNPALAEDGSPMKNWWPFWFY